jgi:hypothetical protein
MTRTRSRRSEPDLLRDQVVLRGVLGAEGLAADDLRKAGELNYDLYGFYGISVWVAGDTFPRALLEGTKLVKFDRYAEFLVGDLEDQGLELWATGLAPHYDVVSAGAGLDEMVASVIRAPHEIRLNPSVDREEH